jgi:hypothetical protein
VQPYLLPEEDEGCLDQEEAGSAQTMGASAAFLPFFLLFQM